MKRRQVRATIVGIGLGVVTACADEPGAAPVTPPEIALAAVRANPYNALSTVISFTPSGADSVRVWYLAPGGAAAATPFFVAAPAAQHIPVLGLAPLTSYRHVIEAMGPGGVSKSDTLSLSTGDLPAEIRTIRMQSTGTVGPGYTITALNLPGPAAFAVAFDSLGGIRWYRAFPGGVPILDARQHGDGRFSVFLGGTFGWQPTFGRYVMFLPSGEESDSYSAGADRYTDSHEMLLTLADGQVDRVHLFSYELRVTDLSRFGGLTNALVAGHQIIRMRPDGQAEFFFNAWDQFSLDDWIEEPASQKLAANIDFDHPNSLDIDRDGHYIASWRNMAEITKIDSRTGAIIWRLGGRNNQFTFVNDPLNGFNGQHSARVVGNGNLLLYDNGLRHAPPESRAVEYAIDPVARTATLVWEFRHTPAVYTPFTGNVQRLSNGNTLVGFAGVGRFVEVRTDRSVVWDGVVTNTAQPGAVFSLYRAYRVPSLYGYQVP